MASACVVAVLLAAPAPKALARRAEVVSGVEEEEEETEAASSGCCPWPSAPCLGDAGTLPPLRLRALPLALGNLAAAAATAAAAALGRERRGAEAVGEGEAGSEGTEPSC